MPNAILPHQNLLFLLYNCIWRYSIHKMFYFSIQHIKITFFFKKTCNLLKKIQNKTKPTVPTTPQTTTTHSPLPLHSPPPPHPLQIRTHHHHHYHNHNPPKLNQPKLQNKIPKKKKKKKKKHNQIKIITSW